MINVEGNYCYFFTKEKKIVLKLSMKRVLKQINNYNNFLKIHRSYVLNIKVVTNFNSKDNTISVIGIDVPVGRIYRGKIMKVLKEILK
jgi:DNA-binding LytR/AlgR family response regulator